MGIPYSREINAAFEQVTPLVAAGFKVLRTTKNISILLGVIQVLTVLFLGVIAVILLAILYSINPDLEKERQELITPAFQWLAAVSWHSVGKVMLGFTAAIGVCVVIAWLVWEEERVEGEDADGDIVGDETEKAKKKNAKGNKKKGNADDNSSGETEADEAKANKK